MKILLFPASRKRVAPDTLSNFRELLSTDLEVRRFEKFHLLNRQVLDRLVTEAHRIAAEQEDDNIARNGKMYEAIETMAEQTVLAFRSPKDADPIVRRILVHHGILEEYAG
ncbi:MAG: hypothetical protein PSV13_21820 [Lacunisphaera sp.]|nr:hypothetical protein [Lacunisphaera sp.]